MAIPALVCVLAAFTPPARAQQPPAGAVKVLEEEVNLLKETIEANNLQIRKLQERLTNAENTAADQARTIAELRKQLARLDVLQKELQQLEARLTELAEAGTSTRKQGLDAGFRIDVRLRPELSINRTDLNSDLDDRDAFWGHRVRFGGDVGWDDWVRARVVLQEARTFGSTIRNTGEVAVHEGWAELRPPMIPGLWIQGGRAEWSYGSERIIGDDDWTRTGRAFDGVRVGWGYRPWFDVDLFYSKIRESQELNGDPDKDFFGVYATSDAIPFTTIDLYYMGLFDERTILQNTGGNNLEQVIKNRIHTVGARVEAVFYGLLLEGEAVFQFGERTDESDPTRALDHFATAYYVDASYQIPVVTRPTIGVHFTTASGDANPQDGKSVDFQPLFPTRHSFLGKMDVISWTNIIDVGGRIELTPPAGFGFVAEFHYFMVAQKRGRLVGLGSQQTPGRDVGRNIGAEIDVVVSWVPSEHLALEAGYSAFIPSTVPDELFGGTDLAQWAYFQARVQY